MDFASLLVRPIHADEREIWDELMAKYHYLGFRKLVGESIRYMVLFQGETVALLGWSSAAYKSQHRDQWIGWSEEQRHQRLSFIANNRLGARVALQQSPILPEGKSHYKVN
ncbi:Druantia anti-phage system protein DruA, partial [Desulfoscipio geothermicus]